MKPFIFLICLFLYFTTYASLNTINYQGVITDLDGSPVSSKIIGLQFRIIESESEIQLFKEETKVLTTEEGFINYKIGSESSTDLLNIDWSQDNLLLEVSIDLDGKQNYSSVTTSSISSVPVSMFSLKSLDSMQQAEEINFLNSKVDLQSSEIEFLKERIENLHTEIVLQNSKVENLNSEVEILNEQVKNLETQLRTPQIIMDQDLLIYLVSSCISIGDSVTEGHIYDYPKTSNKGEVDRNNSYPAFLSKMTGWHVENAGFSGISPSNWWKNKFYEYDYSLYDLAIIELGYNGGLSDTLEEDVMNKTDFNDYADTNTGNYCKIIEGIKLSNPDILIVLNISSFMKEGSSELGVSRSVIQKIAKYYNLPIIDLSKGNHIDLNSPSYHGFTDDTKSLNMVHFNKRGYCAKAAFIFNALKSILNPG